MNITGYEAICNLGCGIDEIYNRAIESDNTCFDMENNWRIGRIKTVLPEIDEKIYNTRCNRLALKCLNLMQDKIEKLIKKYGKDNIAVITATTNTGVEEYKTSKISEHFEIGNPAMFIKNYLGLNNFYTSVSTACSSGIKAFSIAKEALKIADAVIIVGVDPIAKLPLYGFGSLEVLTSNPTIPFSKNRNGINIGEGAAAFILEKDTGIKVLGIGETTDVYHSTCPDPTAKEAIRAINIALKQAQCDTVDYINLHGTGTVSNDLMEANAIYSIFKDNTYCSSTKPLTGHCLGASAAIEIALCCKLLEIENPHLYPHIYDGIYDDTLPKIKLVPKNCSKQVKTVLCTAFGFGGTNTAIILGRETNYDLTKILPHKPPMILIDDVLEYDLNKKTLTSIVKITEDKLFFDKSKNGITSLAGIEFMAQTIGCYAYFKSGGKPPKIGFLLGSRLYNNAISLFENGKSYTVKVKEIFTDNQIVAFDCIIYDENNEAASATVNVYQRS